MAKLTLIELTNVSQFFGQSEYAMFLAQTQDNQIVECGITHNSLRRKGFDTNNLDSLITCQVVTKPYRDSRTNELINPEDRIQMILDGDARLVLFNSVNSSVTKSELCKAEEKELVSLTNAKVKVELDKERKREQLLKSAERMRTKLLAALAQDNTAEPQLTDSETAEPETAEPATAEEELEF